MSIQVSNYTNLSFNALLNVDEFTSLSQMSNYLMQLRYNNVDIFFRNDGENFYIDVVENSTGKTRRVQLERQLSHIPFKKLIEAMDSVIEYFSTLDDMLNTATLEDSGDTKFRVHIITQEGCSYTSGDTSRYVDNILRTKNKYMKAGYRVINNIKKLPLDSSVEYYLSEYEGETVDYLVCKLEDFAGFKLSSGNINELIAICQLIHNKRTKG